VVLDYHTGELRAVVGGRNTPTVKKGWNRAYQSSTEVGSSIKPLAVYGPALDMGLSPASIVYNFPSPIRGWDTEKGVKPTVLAVPQGSVYLFRCEDKASAEALVDRLHLQRQSDYGPQGFGIGVCSIVKPDRRGSAL